MAKKTNYTEASLLALGLVKDDKGNFYRPKTTQQPRETAFNRAKDLIDNPKRPVNTKLRVTTETGWYNATDDKTTVFEKDHIEDIKPNEVSNLYNENKHLITFDVDPMGKPRMTQSDKWKKRDVTDRYWIFKNKLQLHIKGIGFKIPESNIHMVFRIEMPQSWPKKKKLEMLNKPHQQKPDADNILKGVQDSLCEDDSYIWDVRISKLWDWKGSISIYNIA